MSGRPPWSKKGVGDNRGSGGSSSSSGSGSGNRRSDTRNSHHNQQHFQPTITTNNAHITNTFNFPQIQQQPYPPYPPPFYYTNPVIPPGYQYTQPPPHFPPPFNYYGHYQNAPIPPPSFHHAPPPQSIVQPPQHNPSPTITSPTPLNPDNQKKIDQVLLTSFLTKHNLIADEKAVRESHAVKLKTYQTMVDELTHLQDQLRDMKLESQVDRGALMNRIKDLETKTNDPLLKSAIKRKQSKLSRKKKWRKKYQAKKKQWQQELQKLRIAHNKQIDKWLSDRRKQDRATLKSEQKKQAQLLRQRRLRIRQRAKTAKLTKETFLKKLAGKLVQLRSLRREKLKREGHFFPEEDDEFFNKIAKQAQKAERKERKQAKQQSGGKDDVEMVVNEKVDDKREVNVEKSNPETTPTPKQVTPENESKEDEVDNVINRDFWFQAEKSLDNLVRVRHQWDVFIAPNNAPGSSQVPPYFVEPSPPSNEEWAKYLIEKK